VKLADEPESVIPVGGEVTELDADILGFEPAKGPKGPVEGREAGSRGDVPEVSDGAAGGGPGGEGEPRAAADDGSVAGTTEGGQKFRFFEREFDSREAAEQFFRTWDGQIRAANRRLAETNELIERQNRTIEEMRARGGDRKAPAEAPKPAPAVQRLADSIDWDVYRELKEKNGDDWAAEWLALKIDEHQDAREKAFLENLEKKLEPRLSGSDQLTAYLQKLEKATPIFEELANRVNDDGSAAYPEMEDPEFLQEMAAAFDRIPNAIDQGIRGAYLAYLETKDRRSRSGAAAPKTASKPKPLPPTQDLTVSGGSAPRTSPNARPRTLKDEVERGFREELGKIDPVLGF
jgi:hypothetical protein